MALKSMNINPFKTNLQFLIHTKTNKINSQLINDYEHCDPRHHPP